MYIVELNGHYATAHPSQLAAKQAAARVIKYSLMLGLPCKISIRKTA
jgi:hypothetical protein